MSLFYCHYYLFIVVLYEPLFLFLTYMDLLKCRHFEFSDEHNYLN